MACPATRFTIHSNFVMESKYVLERGEDYSDAYFVFAVLPFHGGVEIHQPLVHQSPARSCEVSCLTRLVHSTDSGQYSA